MTQLYRVVVFELDDGVCKRRNPEKPNLLVTRTVMEPEERFEFLRNSSTNNWFSGHVKTLRSDLSKSEVYKDQIEAHRAAKDLATRLSCQGYTVNRDTRLWSIYVVELDSRDIENPKRGYVYVGETCKEHSERLNEHLSRKRNKRGKLYSPVVAEYGLHLRPDLSPKTHFFCAHESKKAESEWADHLRSEGFVVEGGH